ncbi:hypothetical protein [Variovorax sp. CF313]|uniref:hypothetical protein n=1 Tax=Variovorax sp. CF313 TaxID=1144315 RepID=UPI0012FABA57|nr:hypothetical protein [Variovorax sp. CF313]
MTNEKLNPNWVPQGADCFTWIAMDCSGKLAVMSNNGFGDLPESLLARNDSEELLNDFSDFLFEESKKYPSNLQKNGLVNLHFYSSWIYRAKNGKNEVLLDILNDWRSKGNLANANLSINKGMFVFEALDHGNIPGEFPVGYSRKCENGDYYKHLSPTILACIEDIPLPLREIVVKSDSLDFSRVDLIASGDIRKLFE